MDCGTWNGAIPTQPASRSSSHLHTLVPRRMRTNGATEIQPLQSRGRASGLQARRPWRGWRRIPKVAGAMQPCGTPAQTSCSDRTLEMQREGHVEGQLDACPRVVEECAFSNEPFRFMLCTKRESGGGEGSYFSPGCVDLNENMRVPPHKAVHVSPVEDDNIVVPLDLSVPYPHARLGIISSACSFSCSSSCRRSHGTKEDAREEEQA